MSLIYAVSPLVLAKQSGHAGQPTRVHVPADLYCPLYNYAGLGAAAAAAVHGVAAFGIDRVSLTVTFSRTTGPSKN